MRKLKGFKCFTVTFIIIMFILTLVSVVSAAETENEARGNTVGNIATGGIVAQSGDWIYYTTKSAENKGLFKIRTDGTDITKLSDDYSIYINVLGDWVYFSNESDGYKLYKIRTDGTDKTKLNDDHSEFINVVGDWAYYVNRDDSCCIYKIGIDGSGRNKVNDEVSSFINVVGGWIYYANGARNALFYERFPLHKIRTDGTDRTVINNKDQVEYINVVGDWVYYVSANYVGHGDIYRIRTDGTAREMLVNYTLGESFEMRLNVSENWMYYRKDYSGFQGEHLCRARLDGTGIEELVDGDSWEFGVVDEWIYYFNYMDNYNAYKFRIDGTELQLVTKTPEKTIPQLGDNNVSTILRLLLFSSLIVTLVILYNFHKTRRV